MSMNSQQPPRYGAEGPPGGVEEWNRQRFGQEQGKKIPKMFRQLGEAIRNGPIGQRAAEARAQRPTQPDWSTGQGRVQWGQPQGQAPMPGSLGAQMGGGQPTPTQSAAMGGQPPPMPTQAQGQPPEGMRGQMQQFAAQGRNPMGNIGGMLRAATMLRKK